MPPTIRSPPPPPAPPSAQEAITITATNQNQTYGFGGTSAALGTIGFSHSGMIYGSDITGVTLSTNDTTSTSNNYNAGTWTITPSSASGSGVANYSITYTPNSGTLNIAQKALTVSGVSGTNQTYNAGTTIRSAARPACLGQVSGDVVTLGGSAVGTLASANAGTEAVTVSGYNVSGADAANYSFSQPSVASVTISPEAVTIAATSQNPTYGFGGSSAALGTSGFRPHRHHLRQRHHRRHAFHQRHHQHLGQLQRRHLDHHALGASGTGVANYSITYTPNSGIPRHCAKGADGQRLCGEWQDL